MHEDDPNIAFKEWAGVCKALAAGHPSLILRKGGIHEGKGGFHFKHHRFSFFPTLFHEEAPRLKPAAAAEAAKAAPSAAPPTQGGPDPVTISLAGEVVRNWTLADWGKVTAIGAFHVWSEAAVRERFDYTGESCLHVALVRVYHLEPPWQIPYEKRFGGCRSWVSVPAPPRPTRRIPAIAEDAFAKLQSAVEQTLDH